MNPLLVVLASALFAGIVASAVTLAIEKWGGVVGGFLGTLPTTIVPAAIGMHLSLPSSNAFADAMFVAPRVGWIPALCSASIRGDGAGRAFGRGEGHQIVALGSEVHGEVVNSVR